MAIIKLFNMVLIVVQNLPKNNKNLKAKNSPSFQKLLSLKNC